MLTRDQLVPYALYSLLVILIILIFKRLCYSFNRIIEKPKKFSDGKATNVVTPISILEVKVTLPSRIIFSNETDKVKYDPWEMVHCSIARLGGGIVGPMFKVVPNNGSIVAVRRIREGLVKPGELDKWIRFFSQIQGRYLLPMLFSFWYGEEAFVVYEYLCLGSLEELLHGREGIQCTPLNWETRLHVALCVSMAVASIHSRVSEKGEALVCGVIKASNVLIRTDFSSCLTGYETPYLVSQDMVIKRNPGRIAPELVNKKNSFDIFTQKSDVYSFGILLLELITGKKPMINQERKEVRLVNYVNDKVKKEGLQSICDEKLLGKRDSIGRMAQVAKLCLLENPNERPTMDKVVEKMQQLQH